MKTPSTEYKNKKRKRSPPTLVSYVIAPTKVESNILKLLYFLTILKILLILKDPVSLSKSPIYRFNLSARNPNQAETTIIKSKEFQPSLK